MNTVFLKKGGITIEKKTEEVKEIRYLKRNGYEEVKAPAKRATKKATK